MSRTPISTPPGGSDPAPDRSSASTSSGGSNASEFSVSEISGAIKRALEDGFGYVRVRGEISGYRGPVASGHCYFGLKDERAKLDAVIWKGVFGRLRFKPEEGMEVIAQGKITAFPGSSKYQIVIDSLEPAGAGALMALLEERKRRFAAEGLFDDARKKARPFLPRVVGIITSPTGAVIRDMLHGFNERFPTRVVVWPVRVQGEGSAAEIAAAIRGFNAFAVDGRVPRPDVLIVARGGGSLEDLWSFNEDIVVRAAAESKIPLISAVGHETDWTLLDLVADARAPTPTKAAEWAVPKYADLIEQLEGFGQRQRVAVRRATEAKRTELRASARGLPRREDLIALPRQRFDQADRRLGRALLSNTRSHGLRYTRVSARLTPQPLMQRVARSRERMASLSARAVEALGNRVLVRRRVLDGRAALLSSLGYHSVLSRGFALIRDGDGRMLRSSGQAGAAGDVDIEFSDGRVLAHVVGGGPGGGPQRGSQSAHNRSMDSVTSSVKAAKSPSARRKKGGSAKNAGAEKPRSGSDTGSDPGSDSGSDNSGGGQGSLF